MNVYTKQKQNHRHREQASGRKAEGKTKGMD